VTYNFPASFWIRNDPYTTTKNIINSSFAAGGKNIGDGFLNARNIIVGGEFIQDTKANMEIAARALHQALIQGGRLKISNDQVSRYIDVSAPDVDMSWFVYPFDKPISIIFLAEFPLWQDATETIEEFLQLELMDRGDCEETTSPMIFGETVPVESNAVWDRSLPMDRGDCESTTPPMVYTETVAIVSNSTWARDNAQAHQGTYSYKYTKTTVAGGGSAFVWQTDTILTTDLHGFIPGHTYSFGCWLYVPSVGGPLGTEILIRAEYYDSGVWSAFDTVALNNTDVWQQIITKMSIPATATGARLTIRFDTAAALNEFVYIDDITLDPAYEQTFSYRATKTIAAGTASYVQLVDNNTTTDMHGLVAGTTYTFTLKLYIPTNSGILGTEIELEIQDYDGSWAATTQAATNTYDAWQTVTVTRTIRSSATGTRFRISIASAAALNEYFFIDDIEFTRPGNGTSSMSVDASGSDYIINPIIEIENNYEQSNTAITMTNTTDGNMQFQYNDSAFDAGDLLEIDSTNGTVKKNSNNSIENFNPGRFLRLQPTVNVITYVGGKADITFKYRKAYL
jgi:hypothetical protein